MPELPSAIARATLARTPVILVIDDEPGSRLAISAALEQHGLDVVMARNGRQALAALRQVKPDLVLTDITLPEPEAAETLQQIRRERPWIPIMAMSSSGRVDVAGLFSLATKLGIDAIVAKPFDEDRLLDAVQDMLPQARRQEHGAAT